MSEAAGNALGYLATAAGAILVWWPALLLIGAWLAPRLLDSPVLSPRVTGRYTRTRSNHTVVGVFWLSFGLFLSLTLVDTLSAVRLCLGALAAVLAIAVFRLSYPRGNA